MSKAMAAKIEQICIHWFRKGLRTHDNPSLRHCLKFAQDNDGTKVVPLFIIDPHFQDPSYVGYNRMNFLMETLTDLDTVLKEKGLGLFVAKGNPDDVFRKLNSKFNISLLTFERETVEPYGKVRDDKIREFCKKNKITIESEATHTLFDQHVLWEKNDY